MQVLRFGAIVSQLRHIIVMFAVMLLVLQHAAAFDVHRRFMIDPASADGDLASAKRNWNNAAVGLWGKRSAGPVFPGDEDGRLVVKRPQEGWTKLNSLWGKRSSWQTANGLWGKRSGPPSKRFDTGLGEYKRFDAGLGTAELYENY
uniref:Attacin_C domain-containing protein n=1 Tax=Panagrellus redivivus TaxID=6233 RepID=A0A7E4V8G0_PANRE